MKRNVIVLLALIGLSWVVCNVACKQTTSPKQAFPISISRAWNPHDLDDVKADSGYKLVAIEIVNQSAEFKLTTKDIKLTDTTNKIYDAIGHGAFYLSNFKPLSGFVSGWLNSSVPNGNSVNIGRDKAEDPISFVMKGNNAKLLLVYILPANEKSVTVKILDAKPIMLTIKP